MKEFAAFRSGSSAGAADNGIRLPLSRLHESLKLQGTLVTPLDSVDPAICNAETWMVSTTDSSEMNMNMMCFFTALSLTRRNAPGSSFRLLIVLAILTVVSLPEARCQRLVSRQTQPEFPARGDRKQRLMFDARNRQTGFVPASKDEVIHIVRAIEDALAKKDVVAFESVFDPTAFVNRALTGVSLPPGPRAEFQTGFETVNFWTQIVIDSTRRHGDFQFLRLVQRGSEIRAMFRTIPSDDLPVTFQELVISKGTGQGPRVVDMYSAAAGGYLALSLRPLALGGLALSPDRNARPSGVESEILESATALASIGLGMAEGKPREALAAFNDLAPAMAHEKGLRVLKCTVARSVMGTQYEKCVLNFAAAFPGDHASDLLLLDLYSRNKKHQQMLPVVDRLIAAFQDPYLNYFKVDGLLRQNRIDDAIAAVRAAKSAAPHRSEVWVAAIAVLMKLKNHAATAKGIHEVESKFGPNVMELTAFPEFEEFSDSPEGLACLARRAGF